MMRPEEPPAVYDASVWGDRWMRAAFEAAPVAIGVVDAEGSLLHGNHRFVEDLGVVLTDTANRPFVELIAEEDRDSLRHELHKVLTGRLPRCLLLALLASKDSLCRIAATRMTHAGELHLLICLDPISAWPNAKDWSVSQQLEQQRLFRQEAEQTTDRFLSTACHELKTPLSALQLQVQGLLRWEQLRAQSAPGASNARSLEPKIRVVRKTVRQLSQLVDNILDISKLRLGKLTLHTESVDLGELVKEVAQRSADDARRAGCELKLTLGEPVVGLWDRSRLEQVVSNLIQNACKYGRGGTVHLQVEATFEGARFSIQDQGIGIGPQDLERIFEPFERAVGDSRFEGFGLGLWIVRQFIAAMGGRIDVISEPNVGSTFVAELPRSLPGTAWVAS